MTVNSLLDFFKPPGDVHLEQLTSATLMKLEEFREKTATGKCQTFYKSMLANVWILRMHFKQYVEPLKKLR